jgi:CopG family nickel-responsive transcriptional regulator
MLIFTCHLPSSMAGKTRVSLSLSEVLLKEFDDLSCDLGHSNRSVAVGEAMREFLSSRKWDLAKKGSAAGVILLTYDHHSRGINAALTELQHDFPDVVTATMHLHLSRHTCLEVIAFKGEAERVRALAKILQSNKGVLSLKVMTSAA